MIVYNHMLFILSQVHHHLKRNLILTADMVFVCTQKSSAPPLKLKIKIKKTFNSWTNQQTHIYFFSCKCLKSMQDASVQINRDWFMWTLSEFLLTLKLHLWKPFPVFITLLLEPLKHWLFVLILWKSQLSFIPAQVCFSFSSTECPELLGGRERQTLMFEVVDD